MTVTMPEKKPVGTSRAGIGSLETGIRLARVLAAFDAAQPLKRLSEAAGMAPAKAHRYLVSLIRAGLAEQDRATGRYRLGPLALEFGLAAFRNDELLSVGGEVLVDLRDEIDETALLAVWGNRGPVVMRWVESSRPVATNVRPGWVMPVTQSATGRCFAAHLPSALVKPFLPRDTHLRTRFLHSLEAIRAEGLARVEGDLLPGVSAVAAPVFRHDGAIAAVIAALGPEGAFDPRFNGRAARSTAAAARRLSGRLGHHPSDSSPSERVLSGAGVDPATRRRKSA